MRLDNMDSRERPRLVEDRSAQALPPIRASGYLLTARTRLDWRELAYKSPECRRG